SAGVETSVGANPNFAVLGPVRAWRDGEELSLGSPQQCLTLALLVLREGRPVPVAEISAALWGDAAPRGARTTIRTYIYRLRRLLDQEGTEPVITFGNNGYALRAEPDAVDLGRFRRRTREAAAARERGDLSAEAEHLDSALREWAGDALAQLTGTVVEREQVHLE